MKWIGLSLVVAAAVCGCGKKNTPPAVAAAAAASNATVQAAAAQKPLEGVPDPDMTKALKSFVQEKGRLPESMVELKNTKLDGIPRAPAGFMYAIDPVTVEVKLVKQ